MSNLDTFAATTASDDAAILAAMEDALSSTVESDSPESETKPARKGKGKGKAKPSPEQRTTLLGEVVQTSASLVQTDDTAENLRDAFEQTFRKFVSDVAAAYAAGLTETDVRKALQEDAKASGTKHSNTSMGAMNAITCITELESLPGDLPEGYVYRAAANSAVGLKDGEKSIATLIRKVKDTDVEFGGGRKGLTAIFKASETKAEYIAACNAVLKAAADAAKAEKAAARPVKDAARFLKAATGPVGKAADADTPLGDLSEVEALVADLRSLLSEVEVRVAAERDADTDDDAE